MRKTYFLKRFLNLAGHDRAKNITKISLAAICLLILAVPAFAGKAAPLPYTTQQISNNSAVSEETPVLDNGQAVWTGVDAACSTVPCKRDVYFYDSATVRNLTQSEQYGGNNPDIQGGYIVWSGSSGVMLYDGIYTRQIDSSGSSPKTHSGQAIWVKVVGTTPDPEWPLPIYGLFFFDGNTTRQVVTNGPFYSGGFIKNGRIVTKVDNAVVLWENDTLTQITTDATPIAFDGSHILINRTDGLYLWDGASLRQVPTNGTTVSNPVMDNGWVVWSGFGPKDNPLISDYEIFLYDGVAVRQLTNNRVWDDNPHIQNGQVTWQAGSLDSSEIYVWNGTSTYRLTNNTTQDIAGGIQNGQVVWTHATGQYGMSDTEIFLATPK